MPNFLKILFLEIPKMTQKVTNTCISLIATYISCMWNVRDSNMDTNTVIKYIKGEILIKHRYLVYAIDDKMSDMATQQYCALERFEI